MESEVQLIHYLIELHKGVPFSKIKPLSAAEVRACLDHLQAQKTRPDATIK
jgi:hypothetical protein